MSAECSVCGHDLSYEGNCEFCALRDRAEQAEAERDRTAIAYSASQEVRRGLTARAEQAEAALRDAQRSLQRLASPTRMYSGNDWEWDQEYRSRLQYATGSNVKAMSALAATTPGEPTPDSVVPGPAAGALGWEPATCPTCDQFGYIANLVCSDDFHRATTPGESRTERETVTFYVHGTAEAVYEYENAEVPE